MFSLKIKVFFSIRWLLFTDFANSKKSERNIIISRKNTKYAAADPLYIWLWKRGYESVVMNNYNVNDDQVVIPCCFSKQRAAESQRVADLIMERQRQAKIMEQAQRNQNTGGHIFTVSCSIYTNTDNIFKFYCITFGFSTSKDCGSVYSRNLFSQSRWNHCIMTSPKGWQFASSPSKRPTKRS